ncbi:MULTISPECIES: hypothetical protein [unclassified Paraburkholderia]|uniref:hypothetical protein n=1 Tax=unclassified Paraburkholderia TaxID=2615204 RepID=UPI0038B9A474
MSRTRHWALGAVIAALCSFAFAKAPGVPHGGGVAGHSHVAADRAMRGDARDGGHYYRTSAARLARNPMPERSREFTGGTYADGFDIYRPGMRRMAGPSGYPGDRGGRMQYAGAITPVSAESRPVPRPPPNGPVRSGSIRADVARYNEERGSARAMQRPADDPRQPEGSPYRN